MAGNNSIQGDETVTFTDNMSFDGTERGGKMTTNGQLWIGSTSGRHVRLGNITSPNSSITVTNGAGTIGLSVTTPGSIQGDTGSTVSGNIKLYARTGSANAGSTVHFNGVSATEMDLQVTDLITSNTFIGLSAGNPTVSGNANTGLGAFSLGSLTFGSANVAVASGNSIDTGSNNVCMGSGALGNCTSGDSNTALGYFALDGLVSGQGNVSVGYNSCVHIDGSFNVGVGYQSLQNCHGDNNTALGYNSGNNYTSTEDSNVLLANPGVIGESHVMRLGWQGAGDFQVNSTYIAGIVGTVVANAQYVTIDSTTGQLGVTNGSSSNYVATATDYSVLVSDSIIGVTDTSSAWTITMPNAGLAAGMRWTIKDESGLASINNITIDGNGANIDGASTFVINTNYGAIDVYFNGTNYFVI